MQRQEMATLQERVQRDPYGWLHDGRGDPRVGITILSDIPGEWIPCASYTPTAAMNSIPLCRVVVGLDSGD